MKFRIIHSIFVVAGMSATALFNSGCVATQAEQEMIAQQQHEQSIVVQEDMRRLRSRLEAIEQDLARLSQQVNASASEQSRANQSQLQGMNATLDDLQKQIRRVDATREQDKKEIIDALSAKISTMLANSSSRGGSVTRSNKPINSEGYEHVVQPGETISAIAKAYGVRADDIVRANNMQSADRLRVGQKIFVPAP